MDSKTILSGYELKEALLNDERIIHLDEVEERMNNDEEVMRLCYLKDMANDHYNQMLKYFDEDSEEVKKAQKEFFLAKKQFEELPLVKEYLAAYKIVRELYDEINKILFSDLNRNLCKTK